MRRLGFTILEVLIAAVVMTIALVGLGAVVAGAVRRASAPSQIEQAALLAEERLNYFRGQANPFVACGGTYYDPPAQKGQVDPDDAPPSDGLHNVDGTCNLNTGGDPAAGVAPGKPALFVREYLYDPTEGAIGRLAAGPEAGADEGYESQNRGIQAQLGNYGINEIPPTPAQVSGVNVTRVIANDDSLAAAPAPVALANPDGGGIPIGYQVTAPRANDDIRATGPVPGSDPEMPRGTPQGYLPPGIHYVREVWVQTHHPNYKSASNPVPAFGWLNPPDEPTGVPDYVVSITVRVYARDPRVGLIDLTNPASTAPGPMGYPPGKGSPGYDFDKPPLAEVTSFIGLQRNWMVGN